MKFMSLATVNTKRACYPLLSKRRTRLGSARVTGTQQQNAPEGCGSVNQHVVAQEKVVMTNKCKATFMLPTVRKSCSVAYRLTILQVAV
jgi:hypothetical protein